MGIRFGIDDDVTNLSLKYNNLNITGIDWIKKEVNQH